jgi:hypothetical protein
MSFSAEHNAFPLYCLYSSESTTYGACGLFKRRGQTGCMFVSARHVGAMRSRRSLDRDDLLSDAMPWACIACCGESSNLVHSIIAGLSRLEERGDTPGEGCTSFWLE